MKEIEILSNLQENVSSAESKIQNFQFPDGEKFQFKGKYEIVDTYFTSTMFDGLNPDNDGKLKSCLRLRQKNKDNIYLTHKHDIFNEKGVWLYSDEIEVKIEDRESFVSILKSLHFEELVVIRNTRKFYSTEKYEIVLEDIVDLGLFVEVEYKTTDDIYGWGCFYYTNKKYVILLEILVWWLVKKLNAGKPELMLKKRIEYFKQ
jgi:predicted adenylyl cyclase CyaB